jgi:molecular chaperone DnaK
MVSGNKSLGKFMLTDLPPAPRGMPQIEVTFDIDANGIVHVSAKDLGTGKEQSMTITGGSALPKDDIEQMIKDAESHAEEDRQRKEAAELRNQADTLAYQTDKTLKEHGDKLDEATKADIEQALTELRDALKSEDTDAIKTKMEALGSRSQKLAEAIYQASANQPGPTASDADGTDGAASGDDDVVDAEVVDEGDDQQPTG